MTPPEAAAQLPYSSGTTPRQSKQEPRSAGCRHPSGYRARCRDPPSPSSRGSPHSVLPRCGGHEAQPHASRERAPEPRCPPRGSRAPRSGVRPPATCRGSAPLPLPASAGGAPGLGARCPVPAPPVPGSPPQVPPPRSRRTSGPGPPLPAPSRRGGRPGRAPPSCTARCPPPPAPAAPPPPRGAYQRPVGGARRRPPRAAAGRRGCGPFKAKRGGRGAGRAPQRGGRGARGPGGSAPGWGGEGGAGGGLERAP